MKEHRTENDRRSVVGFRLNWRLFLGIATTLFASNYSGAAIQTPPRPLTNPGTVVSPAGSREESLPVDALFRVRSAESAALTPDQRTLIMSANIDGRLNLWKLDLAAGGDPISIYRSNDRQVNPVISPDGRLIAFESDAHGTEQYDIFLVSLTGGTPTNLTNTPAISEEGVVFTPNGKLVAVSRKPASSPNSNLWLIDVRSGVARALTRESDPNQSWTAARFTPDGHFLIANRADAEGFGGSIWQIDLRTGKEERLSPGGDNRMAAASDISSDGVLLAITSNLASSQPRAGLLNIRTKKIDWLPFTPWEESAIGFSPDGRHLLYSLNADGRTSLNLFDMRVRRSRPLSFAPGTDIAGSSHPFCADGSGVLVSHEAFNVPPEFWIAPVGSGSPREITHFNEPTFAGRDLPAASVIHYASYDGTVISALLAMPVNLRRDGSNPMILLAHGGPNEQVTDSFNRVALGLASRGYIVIAPNVRGSSGFGKAFQHANFKDLGGGDLSDELYAVKWLLRTGYVDPKRIGITGTSYGGFMVLMAIGKAPGIWAAAAEGYGVIDWRAMLEDSDPLLQQFVRGLLGDPVNDGAIYRASSPLSYLRSATAPLLVWQGENDIRVPKQQTEAVVAGMRSAGKIVEAHYYSDEGHGLEKRENQVDALRRTIDWFDRYLKHAPGGALQ